MTRVSLRMRTWWRWSRDPTRRWLWYLAAALVYVAVTILPLPGFTPDGQRALAVFAVAAFLWGTNTLPLAVTGLITLLLLPLTGAFDHQRTYAHFGSQALFFILGAFILASPVTRSGLSTRLALLILQRFGHNRPRLLATLLLTPAALSFFISEHAVAAMLFPIVLEVVRAAGAKPGSRFGLAAFLALAWGAVIGGTATLLGGARAPLALGVLQSTTGRTISFLEWTLWALPTVAALLLAALGVLWLLGRDETIHLTHARRHLEARVRTLGPPSRRETLTASVMLLTVLLWVLRGEAWGLDTIALLGVALAFLLRITEWREIEEDVNWGIFLMYGSAIALSAALRDTGAAEALSRLALTSWIDTPLLAFTAIVLLALGLTEAMSNSAAVAVLMPLALALANEYGLDPRAATLGVALPAGLAFMLPVSTPAIAIVVGSGYVRPLEAFRHGARLKILGLAAFLLTSWAYWPLVGLGLGG
ncbi:SLC13 family permease [Marinithermus hydrothermalis]|uniref:Anion transporter n=1 Tax=Marinithermus hydrothermalis (strain DSM 14884 / JCM 11576 / T1) TaxID=869210 RepID=F2NQY8_MARHT|nr:DASS family sodium-coupled anion symporter [Marinithermus hydrothermalis]AEB12566.1 anion transporter [Marinithermus hydrothermalis DSM 14884]